MLIDEKIFNELFLSNFQMFNKLLKRQKGFMSTSLSKKVALEFTFGLWREENPKIPILLSILLNNKYNYYEIASE